MGGGPGSAARWARYWAGDVGGERGDRARGTPTNTRGSGDLRRAEAFLTEVVMNRSSRGLDEEPSYGPGAMQTTGSGDGGRLRELAVTSEEFIEAGDQVVVVRYRPAAAAREAGRGRAP